MSKHTPGEWEKGKAHGAERGKDRDQFYIGDKSKDNKCIATIHFCLTIEETEANANLIAAAPDQNDVLKQLAERIEECPSCYGTGRFSLNNPDACRTCGGIGRVLDATSLIQDIEEAIAKVEGKNEAENKS